MTTYTATFGVGSRVLVAAKAIIEGGRLQWAINDHCPVGHRVVFPDGIAGLQIEDIGTPSLVSHHVKDDYYDDHPDIIRHIFASMLLPDFHRLPLGIHFRGYRFNDGMPIRDFLPIVASEARGAQQPIAVLADSHRDDLRAVLGNRFVPCASRPMTSDLDRDPSDVRSYLIDWWRLLNCDRIVSNCPQSLAIWPHKYLNITQP